MSDLTCKAIKLDEFDANLKTNYIEVSSASLGASVISCSDDFFASKDNLIKVSPSASMKGLFGPNGALYDGWESRRHNPSFDWVIILLAPTLSTLHYVDIDTSHFSGNEAPESQIFGLTLDPNTSRDGLKLSTDDKRWEEILPVVGLGPNSRHIFELGSKAKEGHWSALMVRMIPDGGMARFRAYGHPLPPKLYTTIPPPTTEPINLLSPLLSGRIISASDANFSPPNNLLLPGRGNDMSDGWETRRSQVGRGKYGKGGALEGQERKEWVVAKLGATGVLRFVEVDSAYHVGNYPVACMVEATLSKEDIPSESAEWTTIVTKKPLGPHRQHWFDIERSIPAEQVFSHVRLSIFPDGGLKRLRIFGHPISPTSISIPTIPNVTQTIPALPLTAEAFAPYGQVIQGYGLNTSAPKGIHVNIANQGTAFKFHRLAKVKETYHKGMLKRGGMGVGVIRAEPQFDISNGATIPVKVLERHAHTTQAFIPMAKGAGPGVVPLKSGGAFIVVAALNGKDDKPDLITLRAFMATGAQGVSYDQGTWHHPLMTVDGPLDYACVEAQVGDPGLIIDCEMYTPPSPLAYIQVSPYTAIVPTLPPSHPDHIPDAVDTVTHALESLSHIIPHHLPHPIDSITQLHPIDPVPITPELFAPYGQLVRAYPNAAERPANMEVGTNKEFGTEKYHRLAAVVDSYPEEAGAVAGIAVFRATKKVGLERGKVFDVRYMERHPYTSQAFIPMSKAEWTGHGEEALPAGGAFLVVVAKGGPDDRPDPSTIKSFIMPSNTGLNYAAGTWHHPVLVLDSTLDLACIESQVSTGIPEGDARDCELISWEGEEVFGRINVPAV